MYRATNLTTDEIVRIICAVQHGHCRLINYWLNSLCLLRLKSILSHQNRLTIRHFLSYANQLCRSLPDLVGPINSMDGISNAHPRCRQKWNVNLVGRTIRFVKYRHFFHVRFLLFFLFFSSLFFVIYFSLPIVLVHVYVVNFFFIAWIIYEQSFIVVAVWLLVVGTIFFFSLSFSLSSLCFVHQFNWNVKHS